MDFSVIFDPQDGPAVIVCPKRLDVNNSAQLKDLLNELITRSRYNIILDLEKTKYMDSSGLGAIVSRIADLRANGGDVCIAAARNNAAGLFRLTHLDKILHLYDTVSDARKSLEEQK
jgi:anti-sigma B factor antagonist